MQVYSIAGGIQVYSVNNYSTCYFLFVAGGIPVYYIAGGVQVYSVTICSTCYLLLHATSQKLYKGAELDKHSNTTDKQTNRQQL